MIKRWDTCLTIYGHAEMEEDVEGDYVLYTDHFDEVRELVRLCLSNGIISRGMACEYLGCAREDLDGILDQIATEAGEDGSDEAGNLSIVCYECTLNHEED